MDEKLKVCYEVPEGVGRELQQPASTGDVSRKLADPDTFLRAPKLNE